MKRRTCLATWATAFSRPAAHSRRSRLTRRRPGTDAQDPRHGQQPGRPELRPAYRDRLFGRRLPAQRLRLAGARRGQPAEGRAADWRRRGPSRPTAWNTSSSSTRPRSSTTGRRSPPRRRAVLVQPRSCASPRAMPGWSPASSTQNSVTAGRRPDRVGSSCAKPFVAFPQVLPWLWIVNAKEVEANKGTDDGQTYLRTNIAGSGAFTIRRRRARQSLRVRAGRERLEDRAAATSPARSGRSSARRRRSACCSSAARRISRST